MATAERHYLEAIEAKRRTLREEVEEDVAPLRGLSLEARAKILESVCRDAIAIIRSRPDAKTALLLRDPLSAESAALWQRLVDRYRANHGRD